MSIVNNTTANMQKAGLASGFDFLESTAGFSIIQALVPYSESSTYGQAFMVSLVNTLLVAVIGCLLATILGFLVGIGRLSKNWIVQKVATLYVELFRNVPLLLQIFFWYHAVLKPLPGPRTLHEAGDKVFLSLNNRGLVMPEPIPQDNWGIIVFLFFAGIIASIFIARWAKNRQKTTGQQFPVFLTTLGLVFGLPLLIFLLLGSPMELKPAEMSRFNLKGGVTIIPEFVALVLALSIYTASFIAEIVRAGIQAVNHGQTEAANALGIKNSTTLRLVVIPQALRVIIPPLTSQYLNLTKNSSLAAAIAYPDLVAVFAGTVLNQTGQAVEVMAITMGVYLTISLLTSLFMNWYNSRIQLQER